MRLKNYERPLRICLLTEYFNPGGAGGTPSMLPDLALALSRQYHDMEIEVLTSRNVYRGEGEVLPAQDVWEGIPVHRLAAPRSNQRSTARRLLAGFLFSLRALFKLLRSSRYDLIFVGTNPPTAPLAASILKRLCGTPYVYLIHDLFPDVAVALGTLSPEGKVTRASRARQHAWMHAAAKVVVIGRCMRDHVATTYNLPLEKIAVIPNWSDPERIPSLPHQTRFRAQHNLEERFVVLYAGNFGQYQNFDVLLDAARSLKERQPEISFVFVGNGARREYIATRVAEEQLNNVSLLPFVPEVEFPDLLASADVSLVTLEPGAEGVGVPSKFYNILASARPTVALVSPTCEVARVIEEASCGVRVNQGDATGLAEALVSLAKHPTDAARMGENARTVLTERYTLEAAAERFYHTFCQVLAKEKDKTACIM